LAVLPDLPDLFVIFLMNKEHGENGEREPSSPSHGRLDYRKPSTPFPLKGNSFAISLAQASGTWQLGLGFSPF
jgi:hypothetical protein